jgi:alanyl-tRNA synthetase
MGEGAGNALGWSVELCGGTHVDRTGDIGSISVTGESAIASGVRRIEALTGNYARHHANDTIQIAKNAAAELRTPLEEMPTRIASLREEHKKLERDLDEARKKLAMGGGSTGASSDFDLIQGVKVIARELHNVKINDLRSIADDYKKRIESGIVALTASSDDGKAGLVVVVTPDLTSSNNAVKLVQAGVPFLGGSKGGGRPDFAQGGGNKPEGAKQALEEIKKLVQPSVTAKSE